MNIATRNYKYNYLVSSLLLSALWSGAFVLPVRSAVDNVPAWMTVDEPHNFPALGFKLVEYSVSHPADSLVRMPNQVLSPMSTYVVNSSADTPDVANGDGLCADSIGNCTLRAAIQEANAHPGPDSISFAIGSGPALIAPLSSFPFITESLIIDGTTQPGYAGQPLIEINGGPDPEAWDCLHFVDMGGSTVRGLNIHGFRQAIAFDAPGTSGGNVVEANYLGTDRTGSVPMSNTTGVYVNSRGNRIGGLLASQRNVISGNHNFGIELADRGNVVQGNFIGVNALGTAAVTAPSVRIQNGVLVASDANVIGGTSPAARNIISGGNSIGISITASPAPRTASGNLIQGNFVGTDVSGMAGVGNQGAGIRVLVGGTNTTIGGSAPGAGNVVSANMAIAGISIEGAGVSGNVVQGNRVGTTADASGPLPNLGAGINARDTSSNTIGGLGAGNIISGNQLAGINVAGCSSIFIQDNYIGTTADGLAAMANGAQGVRVSQSSGILVERNLVSGNHLDGVGVDLTNDSRIAGNLVGLAANGYTPVANSDRGVSIARSNNISIENNLISGNLLDGLVLTTSNSSSVVGNLVGVGADGITRVANSGSGIALSASSSNMIGGSAAGAGNVVSGNTYNGILLTGGAASANNQILGNRIGTDSSGTVAVPNELNGINIDNVPSTIIGNSAASNIISGNGHSGISISGAMAANNVAEGNLIGTDITGTVDLGNGQNGVIIGNAPSNTIGAASAQGAANTISGNDDTGVVIIGAGAVDNSVTGNRIGTNAAGNAALPNGFIGVQVQGGASSNRIGYLTSVAGTPPGNIISGHTGAGSGCGIVITGAGTRLNSVYGNLVGTDASGTASVPNVTGIEISFGATQNFIGEKVPRARNVISGNQLSGITIFGAGTDLNQVQNNLIGTDITGGGRLGNSLAGVRIHIQAANNVVGGPLLGSRNIISGTILFPGYPTGGGAGVLIESGADSNVVQGNFIGTDLAGTSSISNAGEGIFINSASNTSIGGDQPGTGNLISGNGRNGVVIDNASVSNRIQNNSIGVKNGSLSPLANSGDGVQISHTDGSVAAPAVNVVGGSAPGVSNIIAFNGGRGIMLLDGIKNSIVSNSIFSNTGIGIDLSPAGPTANDACDADGGPNGLLNYPSIDSVLSTAGATNINVSLDSTASADYTIQIFVNDSCIRQRFVRPVRIWRGPDARRHFYRDDRTGLRDKRRPQHRAAHPGRQILDRDRHRRLW